MRRFALPWFLVANEEVRNICFHVRFDYQLHPHAIALAVVAHRFDSLVTGMSESDMLKCDVMLGIPTNPNFGSLNLAAAVQLIAYDWRMAIGGHDSYGLSCC